MGQLSFYSAEANRPCVSDLAGVLCGPGQAATFGGTTAARLTVELPDRWRALALAGTCGERGVAADVVAAESGKPLVRTAFRADLVGLAQRWLTGRDKRVPEGFGVDGGMLRVWTLTAGRWAESGYLLGLDPAHPQTHEPLAEAAVRAGLPVALCDDGGPAVRVWGVRRLARLVELVGPPPAGTPAHDWPAVLSARRRRELIGA